MGKKRIIIFGTGSISKYLTEHVKSDVEIIAYLTSDGADDINGKTVLPLNQLRTIEYDYIVIAFGNTPKGIEVLKAENVPPEKIVGYAYRGSDYETNLLQKECDRLVHECLSDERIPELFDLPQKRYYVCGMNIQENQNVISRDYVREQTLSLLAEEIVRKKVPGNVAEIGVSQGILARKMNILFPDRTLYLFDTYNGLPEEDKARAVSQGWGEKLYALGERGTPVEKVLEIMPYRDRCVIKQGKFPDTFDLQGELALVSLDLDFYESTKRGLEVLYPHLGEGGYIMVHDYNNLAFTETKNAVTEFCDEHHVACVPIPDVAGTVVLVK